MCDSGYIFFYLVFSYLLQSPDRCLLHVTPDITQYAWSVFFQVTSGAFIWQSTLPLNSRLLCNFTSPVNVAHLHDPFQQKPSQIVCECTVADLPAPSQTDRNYGMRKGNKKWVIQDLTEFPFKPHWAPAKNTHTNVSFIVVFLASHITPRPHLCCFLPVPNAVLLLHSYHISSSWDKFVFLPCGDCEAEEWREKTSSPLHMGYWP